MPIHELSPDEVALLKAAKSKRTIAKSACTRSKTFIDSIGDRVVTIIELKQRQAKFRECWRQFDDAQANIDILESSEEEQIVNNQERFSFEEKYFDIDVKFEELIIARMPPADAMAGIPVGPNPFNNGAQALQGNGENNNGQQPIVNIRLPRIELPTFSGLYEEWRAFHDIFKSMIHNNDSLPDIQKLHYLKASLKGEALDIISSLEISANNYNEAWSLLTERYDNQRVIVQKHIKAIFEQPTMHKENHSELRQLLDTVLKHLRALKVLERPTDKWDDLMIYVITSRLAPVTNKEWETSLKDSTIPTLKQLTDFLSHRCRALEAVDRKPQTSTSNNEKTSSKKSTITNVAVDKPACSFCKGDHPIFHCPKFLELSIDKRFQEIKALKLCINCLKTTEHRAKQCNAGSCKACNKKHNTLLHMEYAQQTKDSEPQLATQPVNPSQASSVSTNHTAMATGHQVLLSTAIVQVRDVKGNLCSCRALLDCGSQSNFVTSDLANRLGLPQRPTCIPITGVGDSKTETHRAVKISMQSRLNGFKAELDCLILRKITQDIPVVSVDRSVICIPAGIKLADPDFLQSSQIDMLIGVATFWNLMCVGQIKATETQPCWQKTHLGWIAAGGIVAGGSRTRPTICNLSINTELKDAVTRFWEIEHGARSNTISVDERKCEEYYNATVRRNEQGRFIVKLPVKEEISRLGQSRETAIRRFVSLEKRLIREPSLKKDYTDFIKEYEALGHLRKLQSSEIAAWPHYYMPHHCVIKKESCTTKLRVVFDASCKTTSHLSLNDVLMVGPTLQQDLLSIIARFRTQKYVLVADITKMYRQVLVDKAQASLQRIVWRDNSEEQINDLELLTVTYGTASAAFLAIKSLRTLAEIEAINFPVGSNVVLRDFYVDDMLTGAPSKEGVLKIRDEVVKLLEKGGFELRKWASNAPDLLESIPANDTTNSILSLDKEGAFKTLGIQWSPIEDSFQYRITLDDNEPRTTKRTILSCIAQIFDPLGLLGPIIILAKILIQKLWTLQLDWDESLTTELHTEWRTYKSQLNQLKQLKIPRLVVHGEAIKRIELHGFCDASQSAYGACIYIRSTDQGDKHYSNLLCSKSRVAPLKAVSLPRLELCGAQLLAQLVDKVVSILELKIDMIWYWTDATIVLDWIQSPSRKFNTFVSNRVGEIQEITNKDNWRHVNTGDNPADALSRGTNPELFMQARLWWSGPAWLSEDQSSWPQSSRPATSSDELPEQRKVTVITATTQEDEDIFRRFSSYVRLIRVVATCLRFAHKTRSKQETRVSGAISAQEFEGARRTIIKRVQLSAFEKEISAIENQQTIPRNSSILSLNPFLDCEGLLRVGGRLKNSNLPYTAKHPLLLPANHTFTQLVIEYEHKRCFHAGPQATLSAVRSRYWPVGARRLVRSIVHKCVTCFKAKPIPSKQIMGDLPMPRITPSRPFSSTGIDYCGPIFTREGKRRNAKKTKAWIAIFICLSTKAVHIELVSDLSTEGFLNALKRFIGRRGKPSDIFSDNGTNFVGANRELEDLRSLFNQEKVRKQIINETCADAITWHFIPPRAPHFGGLWEAAVRSMKHHLNRVAADQSLTFEETATLLIEIEAILNSRPLTPMSPDPDDYSCLTPGHFLIGDSLTSYPEPNLLHLPMNRLSRWQRIEQIRQHFWSRWSVDYLHQLQQRTKWKKEQGPPLKLGQLVVVRDADQPPQSWLLGRIVVVHPGSDGIVRAASVKTSKGTFKRPAAKLCILPIET